MMIEFIQYFGIAILGMVIHFVKRKVKNDTSTISWNDYFKVNMDKTILTFLAVVAGIILLYQIPDQLNITSSFFLGYAGDSILNKWDKKIENENGK